MNLSLLKTFRPSSTFARGRSLIHAECPIEQTLRSDDPTVQDELMREPWSRRSRPEGTLYVADYNGLRLLGRSEAALDAAVEPLRRRLGVRIIIDAPSVRYVFGSSTLEPHMTVLLNGPARHVAIVERDFLRRHGRIKRLDQRGSFILEGEATLANLLGYRQWLRDLIQDDLCLGMWLSRYLPIDDDGPRDA